MPFVRRAEREDSAKQAKERRAETENKEFLGDLAKVKWEVVTKTENKKEEGSVFV